MPSSNGKLCGKCLAISWNPEEHQGLPDQDGFENWPLNHYKTLSELETSCETGCPLCQTLFLLLTYDVIDLKDTDMLHWNVEHNRGICLDEDLRAVVNESINPWVEACTRSGKHNSCPRHPPHDSESYTMPTRLIDVGSDDQSTARLLETTDLLDESKKRPYVILSYRWGSGNDPARTTSRNLKERRSKIACDTLPKTIQDAIRITRLMKIQYLWVDAVCIIQSDRTLDTQQKDDVATADWERESMRMASYYANSLCCIAASNANDSSEGILSERRVARYGFKRWYNPANVFLPSPFALRRRFPSSLSDRGWCFQEWILSPRILHWTANGLIWECSDGFFWEGQSGFKGEPPESFGETRFESKNRKTNDCLLELGLSDKETEYICQILRSEKE
ncbi:heterokaryon incompatibility protein-domain-containing protein [Fusarium tricinctum]|uniref:Heterokaryon incompatibility protein-domain-containing protein n=1 Tax=Fusarium tricinctum TaxID=61284 RepID=A0A8K0WGB9_9HYPO|nr:heterokaryon incompatibility protein-domain-containing protein [Fusarium tricinctum]